MLLIDVNVMIYAFREDTPNHLSYKQWLNTAMNANEAIGVVDLLLSGFLRIVTHPRIFRPPTPMEQAILFVERFRSAPLSVGVAPGERHWGIFVDLCRKTGVKGNLVPDAYLAALAIEFGYDWITTDREYARFPHLRVRHPLS